VSIRAVAEKEKCTRQAAAGVFHGGGGWVLADAGMAGQPAGVDAPSLTAASVAWVGPAPGWLSRYAPYVF